VKLAVGWRTPRLPLETAEHEEDLGKGDPGNGTPCVVKGEQEEKW